LMLLYILNGGEHGRTVYWRKGWDSNPRYPCRHAGFQDRCLKPLGHPSVFAVQRLSRGEGPGKASIAAGRNYRQLGCRTNLRARLQGQGAAMVGRLSAGLAECQREQTRAQQYQTGRRQREESF
jgi:hypothetical protein